MPGIVLSFHDVSALFLWFWIYLLSQPVESTHTGIPKLHLPIPATLNTPPVTEGAFGHLLNRALANIALPNSRIDKSHPRADWHVRVDSKYKHWGLCYKELAIWRRLTCLSRTSKREDSSNRCASFSQVFVLPGFLCQFGQGAGGFAISPGDFRVKAQVDGDGGTKQGEFVHYLGFNIRGLVDTYGFSWGWLGSGRIVNGLPHEVPSGDGILTLGVLEGLLYLAEEFAPILWVRSPGCVYAGSFLVAHQGMITIAFGAVVAASGENVG